MSAASYFVGLLFFAGTWGAVVAAAGFVVSRRLPHLRGSTRVLAWGLVGTAGIIASVLVPAALGVLTRGTEVATALLLLALAWRLPATNTAGGPPGFPPSPAPDRGIDLVLAAVGVAGFVIWVGLAALHYRTAGPGGFDSLNAYMPTVARWIQTGSIWHIADWVPGAFYGSGPGNGGAVVASALVPWHDDFVARFSIYPYVLMTAFAVYALARELGAPAAPASLLGVMAASIPVVAQPGLAYALHDPVMYSTFAAGLVFGARHHRAGARSDLWLAALGMGLAFGTKYYGYTSVAAVFAVWIVARLIGRSRPVRVARDALEALVIVLFAGGIWMLRDWIVAGNPLLPRKVELLGITVFAGPHDPLAPVVNTNLASYLDQPSVWTKTLVHQFRIGVGLPLIVATVALLAAVVVLARRRPLARIDATAATVAAMAAVIAIVYAVMPTSAPGPAGMPEAVINIRYGIPALIAAAGVAGWLAAQLSPRWRTLLAAVALLATIDALRVGTTTAPSTVYAAYAAAGVAVAAAFAIARTGWRPGVPPARTAFAASALLVVALAIVGQRAERAYDAARYRGLEPAVDWVNSRSGSAGASVGLGGSWTLAGISPTYPLFGASLQNRVTYLGSENRGLLTSYRREGAFNDAVRAGRYDFLVLGRAPHLGESPIHAVLANAAGRRELRHPPEERWARRLGYRVVLRDDRFVVMRRPQPRD